jgi:beta-N-acetylhexosaminidase
LTARGNPAQRTALLKGNRLNPNPDSDTTANALLRARQNAGQLIMIRMPGTQLDADTAQFLRTNRIRAICLFRQNMVNNAQVQQLTADLRAVMGPHALIALDQEGGAVVRATWLPAAPAAMALGAADDLQLAREVGAAVARGVRSLGFNWNFAPVLDLNNNLDNPVIAERAFGVDPQRATALAAAWMAGSLAEGVACCVKHAPGHGDTHVDSHRALPTVDKSLAALQALEFSPFAQTAAIAPAMMTAHIVYPALDPVYPATLSHRILTTLIRKQWQYRGVVITDGMDMAAIAGQYGVANAAGLALLAGADMVMALGDRAKQEQTLDALAALIMAGTISEADVAARLVRLDQLATNYPCASGEARHYQTEAADRELMRRAWRRGLTAYRQPQPPAAGSRVRLVVRADASSDGVSEAGLQAAELAAWLGTFYDVACSTFADQANFDWGSLPVDGRLVILASTTRVRYGALARRSWRPDLHLALWNPFQVLDIDAPAIITYGSVAPALAALGGWLRGEWQAEGKNPCLEIASNPTSISPNKRQ